MTAPDATTADAWSTAFALMTRQEIVEIAPLIGGMNVYLATVGSVAQIA